MNPAHTVQTVPPPPRNPRVCECGGTVWIVHRTCYHTYTNIFRVTPDGQLREDDRLADCDNEHDPTGDAWDRPRCQACDREFPRDAWDDLPLQERQWLQ